MQSTPRKIILFNKPFRVLSQFSDNKDRTTLKEYIQIKSIYAAGRLDYDSEGLLVLTNDGKLAHKLTSPQQKTSKTYWVQVEGTPTERSMKRIRDGIELTDGLALPAKIKTISEPENLWPRYPPIRYRESIPTSWVSITISEGRNRQIRRMTAAIGHPTLRLIRYRVGSWTLDGINTGQYMAL